MKKIKTFKDACKVLDLDVDSIIPDFSCYPEYDRKALESQAKLIIIVKAANRLENNDKEWFPDWSNSSEYKYQPYFYMNEGSSGFRSDAYDFWCTTSIVGSRLCFISKELGEYISNQFIDLYQDFFFKNLESQNSSEVDLSGKKVSIEVDGKKYSATID